MSFIKSTCIYCNVDIKTSTDGQKHLESMHLERENYKVLTSYLMATAQPLMSGADNSTFVQAMNSKKTELGLS